MAPVKATWRDGRVVLDGGTDWPEGQRLIVTADSAAGIKFLTEDEQGDDPAAVQAWVEDLLATPPVPCDPAREAERAAWDGVMRQYNIEAVRRQFEGGAP